MANNNNSRNTKRTRTKDSTKKIKKRSTGYARNYLLPKQLAMVATEGAVSQAAAMRRARDQRDAHDRAAAEEVARRLVPKVITIPAKAGSEGRLFGSVTSSDVVEAVAE